MTQQIWFTSDTHFGHANVIRYSNRPYKDKEEMDEGMIANWNSRVQPGDLVYHLGDVFFCQESVAAQILRRLNGEKFLIFGNHDKTIKRSEKLRSMFVKCVDYQYRRAKHRAVPLSDDHVEQVAPWELDVAWPFTRVMQISIQDENSRCWC